MSETLIKPATAQVLQLERGNKVTITKIDDDSAELSTVRNGQAYTMKMLLFTEKEVEKIYELTDKLIQEGRI